MSALSVDEAEVQDDVVKLLASLGWQHISRTEMDIHREGRMNEVVVEPLLVEGILALNDGLGLSDARQVAAEVRRLTSDRSVLEVLRDGVNFKPAPDAASKQVRLIDATDPSRNSFVVTEEFAIKTGGQREPRLDVVCLVNGLPLGVIENKGPSHPLEEASRDFERYWDDAPAIEAFASVVGLCNGVRFRVGPSGLDDIDDYMEWKDPWPAQVVDADDEVEVSLTGGFAPSAVVDLAVNFVVFETRDGKTTKKLARYQQYRATNKLVARVVGGVYDRGLVWHATGSGKSLTMVFAARKLRRSGLKNPTILIVIDRTDLDEQISGTLAACDFDGVVRAMRRSHLESLLSHGGGGVIVTTVHKFGGISDELLAKQNVIAFVDEAHRTQYGGLASRMRAAIPNARLFGFTGTPIELENRSTREWFSPVIDGEYEDYLDKYGFEQAVRDHATVPVLHQARMIEWKVVDAGLDARFEELFGDLTSEDQDRLRREGARDAVVAKAPPRLKAIVDDAVAVLQDQLGPVGLKAQLVAVDRFACAAYGELLAERLDPSEFAVIMSRDPKKDSDALRRWWASAQWERVHGGSPPTDAESGEDEESDDETEVVARAGERAAIKDFIRRFKSDQDPLRLLVVNSMLLTGFDAPLEQVLFLDRPLHGHTLLQAIARTNRRHPGKDYGLVVDYWGVFAEVQKALAAYASGDVKGVAEGVDVLVHRFPDVIGEGLSVLEGLPEDLSRRKLLLRLLDKLVRDDDARDAFETAVDEAQGIYETLAPSPALAPFLDRFASLLELHAAWRRQSRADTSGLARYRAKTQALVQSAIDLEKLREDLPIHELDAQYLGNLASAADDALSPDEKAAEIEAAVVHEITVRGERDPLAMTLSERLAELRERRLHEQQMTLELLGEYEDLVRQHVHAQEASKKLGLSPMAAALFSLLRRAMPDASDERSLSSRMRHLVVEFSEQPPLSWAC
jgi:type I restriction enzyme, R subunit